MSSGCSPRSLSIEPLCGERKTRPRPILHAYADWVPGAWVEEKEFPLAFHYRAAEEKQGAVRASESIDDLAALTANTDVWVLEGNRTVEVRNARIHKKFVSQRWLLNCGGDFILAIGDDLTDAETEVQARGTFQNTRGRNTEKELRSKPGPESKSR